MKHRTLALSLSLTALVLTAIGGAAIAQTDQVVHPNSSCRWVDEWANLNPDPEIASYYYDGMYHRDLTSTHTAVCGIDRFNLTNTTGLRDLDVRLYNINSDAPATIRCTAFSSRPDGTFVKAVAAEVVDIPHGPRRLDFNGALDLSVAYGAYSVACEMPPYVKINNLLQREY